MQATAAVLYETKKPVVVEDVEVLEASICNAFPEGMLTFTPLPVRLTMTPLAMTASTFRLNPDNPIDALSPALAPG